jgi:hypothetical protein
MHIWINEKHVEQYLLSCNMPPETLHIMLRFLVGRAAKLNALGKTPEPLHFKVVEKIENFRLTKEIIPVSPKGKALCLLKTQFAKKPKNPV